MMRKPLTDEQKRKNAEYKKNWYLANKERLNEIKKNKKEELSKKRKAFYNQNKEKLKEDRRKFYHENKEKNLEQSKKYTEKNRDKVLKKKKEYRENNKEKIKTDKRNWDLNNKDNIQKYISNKLKTDSVYALSISTRNLINKAIKRKGFTKKSKTIEILGCSFEEFKTYLELKFEPWMNWENYGKYDGTEGYGWDIDHIIPLSLAKTEDELMKLNHYSNLQPLCSYVNRILKKDFY
jgi:hypothetical protein